MVLALIAARFPSVILRRLVTQGVTYASCSLHQLVKTLDNPHSNLLLRSPPLDNPDAPTPTLALKLWDVASGQCVHTLRGHNDEILDVSFNATGSKLLTASADGTCRVFNTINGACQAILIGHEGEISKVPSAERSVCACMCDYSQRQL